ncbi:DMT family transporter [Nonomuraea pusilla]|nr:DMT family transporter [Nonomuraea pusilla]
MAVVPAPRPLLGAVLLLFVSAAWGSAFPLMKDLMDRMPVEDLVAERYLIAAVTLLLIRPRCLRGLPRATWINGVVLGVMFGVGQTAQAVALHGLPSAVSGFAVGCSVIITPILALVLFKVRVPRRVWAGVVLALAGMAVFTLMRGMEDSDIDPLALGVTLSAAALYSGHTLVLARLSTQGRSFHAYALTVIQLFTIGVLTGLVAAHDGIVLPAGLPDWTILAHLSVVSCALGFLARSYGQAHVSAVPSAVLMSSQPLWVAAIAVIWFDEQVGLSMLVGGGLMAAAMLLAVPGRAAPPGPEGEPAPVAVPASGGAPAASASGGAPVGASGSGGGPARDPELLAISAAASKVLAGLRVKPEERSAPATVALPYVVSRSACRDAESCPWNAHSVKGGREPSLERLIERATLIVRSRGLPGPGCCQSVTLLGRCLCSLMEEAGRREQPHGSVRSGGPRPYL